MIELSITIKDESRTFVDKDIVYEFIALTAMTRIYRHE